MAERQKGGPLEDLRRQLAALSDDELRKVQNHVTTAIRSRTRLPAHVPVEIFATELSPAEALVKHLKEQHALTFSEIARLLNRDQRGIWGSYARAQRKAPAPLPLASAAHAIPLSCFSDRSRSVLEHVVTHLKDAKQLPVSRICVLLKKKPSTIWTAYRRSRRKQDA